MRLVLLTAFLTLAATPALADFRSDYQAYIDQEEHVADITKQMLQLDPAGSPWNTARDKCDLFNSYNGIATHLQKDILMAENGGGAMSVPPFETVHPTKDDILWMKQTLITYQNKALPYLGGC